jgi:hypothetical protein
MDSSNKTLSVVEFDRTVNATTPALNPKEIAKRNEKKIPFLHDSWFTKVIADIIYTKAT